MRVSNPDRSPFASNAETQPRLNRFAEIVGDNVMLIDAGSGCLHQNFTGDDVCDAAGQLDLNHSQIAQNVGDED